MPNAAVPLMALLGLGAAVAFAASSKSAAAKTPPSGGGPAPGPAPSPSPTATPMPSAGPPASSAPPAAPGGATVTLDTSLPAQLEDQVVHALSTSQDPAELSALADQLDAQGYPLAAAALRARAAELQARASAAPAGAPPPASTPSTTTAPTALPGLDANIGAMGPAVLAALSTETDPAKLIGFAHAIQDQFPMAAAALMTKAAGLQAAARTAQAVAAAAQGITPGTSTTATPAAATPPGTPPTAAPVVTPVATPAPVTPGAAPAMPQGPGAWVLATDADVARDGVAPRYAALLSQAVGTAAVEPHNGRTWEFRVVSKTTDPDLTTFDKDVKGWVWQPSATGAPVAPAPVLTPVVTARTMASVPPNAAIRALQHSLNVLGAQPPLAEDGISGPKTIAAVKAFQTAHGLTVDGIAGPQTNGAIATALAAAAAVPSAPPPAPPLGTPAPAPTGPAPGVTSFTVQTVTDVQNALNQLGVVQPPLATDGIAGPKTQAAVRLFQLQNGLAVDGVAGPKTKAALGAALAQMNSAAFNARAATGPIAAGRRMHLQRGTP